MSVGIFYWWRCSVALAAAFGSRLPYHEIFSVHASMLTFLFTNIKAQVGVCTVSIFAANFA